MKVLFITYDGLTDNLGGSQILPYLTGLAGSGHKITILSCEKPGKEREKELLRKTLQAKGIEWSAAKYHKRPPVLSSIFDAWSIKRRAAALHRREKFDLVHCRSYLPSLVGLWLKRKYGIRLVFDMRGFWADERVDGGLWNLLHPLYRAVYGFFKRKEKEFLIESDAVISLTEAGKREMLRWDFSPTLPSRLSVIPCCVDLDHFNQAGSQKSRSIAREALGFSSNDLVCSYLGSTGTWYLLSEMMAFFRCFSSSHPSAKFLFITPDPESVIRAAAEKAGISPSKLVVLSAKREMVPGLLSAVDFGLFFIRPSYSKISSSATKLAEFLAMGIPVISNQGVGDQTELFGRNAVGHLVAEFTVSEYEKAIAAIPSLLRLDRSQIRALAEREFSLAGGVAQYHKIYNSLAREGSEHGIR